MNEQIDQESISTAADWIGGAEAIVVAAGAGMGVDSGLPDFRGPEGFWAAYPAYRSLGLNFEEMANPEHFKRDPELGWGFYGHRTNLYRSTEPHEGFAILRRWVEAKPLGGFVFTSNVDDHFGKAGFDRSKIVEIHGSVEWRQCLRSCGQGLFPADPDSIEIDPETFRALPPLPACLGCGGLARPNILMFGDWDYVYDRTDSELHHFSTWLQEIGAARLVVVELGAGRAVPSVRRMSEQLIRELDAKLIRINVREGEVPEGQIGLGSPALATLQAIDRAIVAH